MACGLGLCFCCVRDFNVGGGDRSSQGVLGRPGVRHDGGAPMIDLSVRIGGLTLANPVMPASGTFAEGLDKVMDFNRLGAFVTKTITRELRAGNPLPRVVERPGGLINSIGIPSKGVPYFLEHTLPHYAAYRPPLVVSISAPTAESSPALPPSSREPALPPSKPIFPVPTSRKTARRSRCGRHRPQQWSAQLRACNVAAAVGEADAEHRRSLPEVAQRGRSRRRRCAGRGQHDPRHGDRPADVQAVPRQCHGRPVGPGRSSRSCCGRSINAPGR